MLNRVCLIGRLVSDPELRKSNSDISFATFTIAVDNATKEADETRGTCFLDGRVFGTQAENLVKYTKKGSKIAVDGSLNQRNFIRQDGTKGKSIEIVVNSVTFLDPKPVSEEQEAEQVITDADLPDDDLPFKEEETKPQEKVKPSKKEPQPKYAPYTGKPLKPSKK